MKYLRGLKQFLFFSYFLEIKELYKDFGWLHNCETIDFNGYRKVKPCIYSLILAYTGLFLIVMGRMNIILIQYLFVLLGFISSTISFKYKTQGLGVFVFVSSASFVILGIISFLSYIIQLRIS